MEKEERSRSSSGVEKHARAEPRTQKEEGSRSSKWVLVELLALERLERLEKKTCALYTKKKEHTQNILD